MSRAFVKETDREELPLVPPRAHLPAGTPNYVTPQGFASLQEELKQLQLEKQHLQDKNTQGDERRIALYEINEKIRMLQERLSSAQTIDYTKQTKNEVHFGATVNLGLDKVQTTQTFKIVGVDEANITKGKIAFTSPLAKALAGKQQHEKAEVKLPGGIQTFTILSISYED